MKKHKSTKQVVFVASISLFVIATIIIATFVITRRGNATDLPLPSYWALDSSPAKKLRDYVSKVTNPNNKNDFIPVKDRIAVFDVDGTLTCETFYTYL